MNGHTTHDRAVTLATKRPIALVTNTEEWSLCRIASTAWQVADAAWQGYTYPEDLTGQPAISVSIGVTGDGRPVGGIWEM